jgi:glycosyltransferase involved in cell wall biosynthesis
VSEKPLVSALLNTYNYARYLPMAINSVVNQTYGNIEIIVVDDGSTDETPQVLQKYADRVRIIRVKNGGQANAFNIGIPACRGELVMLLDADDQWLPTKVERMVAFAARHPKAGMLYHRFVNIDAHGFVHDWPQPLSLLNGDCRAHYLRTAGSYWGTVTSTMVLRPQIASRILPIPTYGVREGADSVLADCCVLLGEVAGSTEMLAHRRLHGTNFYAAGRELMLRSAQVRAQDVRRVEWRMEIIRQIMERLGVPFEVDIERNEWRTINQYLLGNRSFFRMAYNCLTGGTPGEPFMTRYKRVLLWADTKARERRELGAAS